MVWEGVRWLLTNWTCWKEWLLSFSWMRPAVKKTRKSGLRILQESRDYCHHDFRHQDLRFKVLPRHWLCVAFELLSLSGCSSLIVQWKITFPKGPIYKCALSWITSSRQIESQGPWQNAMQPFGGLHQTSPGPCSSQQVACQTSLQIWSNDTLLPKRAIYLPTSSTGQDSKHHNMPVSI